MPKNRGTEDVRQGRTSPRHNVVRILVISTVLTLVGLVVVALISGWSPGSPGT